MINQLATGRGKDFYRIARTEFAKMGGTFGSLLILLGNPECAMS
jgi:hypothetical protein